MLVWKMSPFIFPHDLYSTRMITKLETAASIAAVYQQGCGTYCNGFWEVFSCFWGCVPKDIVVLMVCTLAWQSPVPGARILWSRFVRTNWNWLILLVSFIVYPDKVIDDVTGANTCVHAQGGGRRPHVSPPPIIHSAGGYCFLLFCFQISRLWILQG